MIKKLKLSAYICLALCNTSQVFAVDNLNHLESVDDASIAIYATACEKIKSGEAISSIRMRATDKASFTAVNSISELSDLKKDSTEHDFNVLVYNIVDNLVEDLTTRTTEKSNKKICVEVTGFIPNTSIAEINREHLEKTAKEEKEKLETESKLAIEKMIENKPITNNIDLEKRSLVYVAPTKFYNDTISKTYSEIIKSQIEKLDKYYVTDDKSLADYIIKSSVLRAKIDPINQSTNRLQMVVSVELEDISSSTSTVEHQNRFELFSASEDEQKVAYKLMKKLIENANEIILHKMNSLDNKKFHNKNKLPEIITPSH